MSYLSVVIGSSVANGVEQWYWEMRSPSGPTACYSPYFTCLEGAARAARAFIFNMNCSEVNVPLFDKRIMPTTDPDRLDIPFEIYFRDLFLQLQPAPIQESSEAPKSTPVKKGHLSLVTDT